MSDKPDCYKCEYRERVSGSTHLSCHHPLTEIIRKNAVLTILALTGRASQVKIDGLNVVGNPIGIARGWFSHPFDFDSTWLISCDGFVSDSSVSLEEHTLGVRTPRSPPNETKQE
jgi:hypothetical protein